MVPVTAERLSRRETTANPTKATAMIAAVAAMVRSA
jgi:hypothetical protein